MTKPKSKLRLALVIPHLFIHRDILPRVIFSPGELGLALAEGLDEHTIEVTLYTPGPADTSVPNVTADLSYFESELDRRGDAYLDLLKKHPATFVAMARQVQSEVLAKAFAAANAGEHDIVHVYTNEEDLALPFSRLCTKPVVFTHHDPYNFLVRYKNNFPKYTDLNWISLSYAQRKTMPEETRWVGNVYHGLDPNTFTPVAQPSKDYVAYLGRIVQPKGVHLAIDAVTSFNTSHNETLTLKIAGKHYADTSNDDYWQTQIEPRLNDSIEYVGFLKTPEQRRDFLANAKALIVPSLFEEPFGMVLIEALASGTPIIGLDSGAIPEIISARNGILVEKSDSDTETSARLANALNMIDTINRQDCRDDFERRFTLARMCQEHATIYKRLVTE